MSTRVFPSWAKPLLWGLAIGGILAGLIMFTARSEPDPYRRFVSKPLSDGSRYTFLYPAYLQTIQEDGPGASPEVAHNVAVYNPNFISSPWEALMQRAGLSSFVAGESVNVVVIPLHQKGVRPSRTSEEWKRGDEQRHNEYLVDARTGTQFNLYYSCPRRAPAQFEVHKQRIAESLQVLPPGGSVPAP